MEVLLIFRILHEHMKKLARVITLTHKDLGIPKIYHYECPWPAAQAEIYMINAYKVSIVYNDCNYSLCFNAPVKWESWGAPSGIWYVSVWPYRGLITILSDILTVQMVEI